MQVTETSTEGLKRAYKVIVGADEIEAKTQAKLAEIGNQVNIPGFRPGKAPRAVVHRRSPERNSSRLLPLGESGLGRRKKESPSKRGFRWHARFGETCLAGLSPWSRRERP